MKLEDMMVSLDLAKELKEAGWVQDNSAFYLAVTTQGPKRLFIGCDRDRYAYAAVGHENDLFAAPTVAELDELLPPNTISVKRSTGDYLTRTDLAPHDTVSSRGANSRALMYLYLKEKGLI